MQCPECGFDNADGANYCQKCGAYLGATGEIKRGDTTEAYAVDDTTGALKPVDLDRVSSEGATIVIRSGGGRGGGNLTPHPQRVKNGGQPDARGFLQDGTGPPNHPVLGRPARG